MLLFPRQMLAAYPSPDSGPAGQGELSQSATWDEFTMVGLGTSEVRRKVRKTWGWRARYEGALFQGGEFVDESLMRT